MPRGRRSSKYTRAIDINVDLEKMSKAIHKVGKEVGEEIQDAYAKAVTKFYNDYKPTGKGPFSYRRTYSTYEGSSGYRNRERTYKRTGKYSCRAGIKVGGNFISGTPYAKNHGWKNPSNEFIFGRTFYQGIHGFTTKDVSKYNAGKKTEPWNMWRPGGTNFNEYAWQAAEAFGLSLYEKFTIPPKSTPPVSMLNTKYVEIYNSLDKRFDALGV